MVKKTFIIAEAGVNHNGSLKLALKLVDTAAKMGADAVKFQTFKSSKLTSAKAKKAPYQLKRTSKTESQQEMIRKLELSEEDHVKIIEQCKKRNITFLSSPFDEGSADLLRKLKMTQFKIPSGEITNKGLLQHIAKFGRPMILSTGMSTLADVRQAVSWVRQTNKKLPITLLHCVTEYPAPFNEVNLKAMHTLEKTFKLPVGYSDHTPDIEVPIAAVALGACVIEKHFTLDRSLPGPDHKASLEPSAFAKMIEGIRRIELALGDGIKRPMPCELANKKVARKSLVVTRDLKAGHKLSTQDLTVKRPGNGLAPSMKEKFLGKTLKKPIFADDLLTLEHF